MKHDLHSLKKNHLSDTEYLAKIKNLCDLLSASSHPLSDTDQVDIVLIGLSAEFEPVVTVVLFALESISMDHLIDILLECESRQKRFIAEALVQANLVHHLVSPSDSMPLFHSEGSFS